jgi:23S rRNA (cytidine1920-2'-O)/16S rRNA (cytidine1409-2'-O)-methyltransferase
VVPSPLPGPSGNREFFLWLVPAPGVTGDSTHEPALAAAVDTAVAWRPAPDESTNRLGRPPEPPAVVVRYGQDAEQKELEP